MWGRGGRNAVLLLITALAMVVVLPAAAVAGGNGNQNGAVVPSSLIDAAQANPDQVFHVIVQGTKGTKSDAVGRDVGSENGKLKRKFVSISGVSADLTGKDLLKLAKHPGVSAITADVPVRAAGVYENAEMWRYSADVAPLWTTTDPNTGLVVGPAPQSPTVAIIDSGVDATKVADFGSRILASVNLSSLSPGAIGDDEGHGTMVAGVLAGASKLYPGVAQNAPIVSIRTSDASGQSITSDVIAAADWVMANKARYNIRVANFSMAGATATSFRYDPLDRAVENLWFNGVVVVAAAGNHGTGTGPVEMSYAPGNDPFVITVGATDQMQTADPLDDTVPWWSAYGKTMDAFSKPEVVAPGRYIISPVPMGSTLATTAPDRVVAPGYMWMSGTSFSAPVVSGAAAQILARHPDWGPNEVKGALMLTSNYLSGPGFRSAGVGEIDAATAASLDFTPPNPNENLDVFINADPLTGGKTFDQASWASAVAASASWASASWDSASWDSASWDSASWDSASWDSASWNSNVASAMQTLASWNAAVSAP
jgi:serine protease AprX